jgi:protein-disulfide reductase (glutathione)
MLEGPVRAVPSQILGLCLALACGAAGEQPPAGEAATASDPAPRPRRVASAPANGWGETIAWRPFSEGLAEAKRERMPVMLVVHTAWCGKCKALKHSAFRDPALHALSERFVMVNLDQDSQPEALDYAPDGSYIPRVVFLDPDGRLDAALHNPRPSRFAYFYAPSDDLLGTMQRALELHAEHG